MVTAAEGRHRAPLPAPAAAAETDARGVELTHTVETLLEAMLAVSADLDLDGVLRRTLEAACALTGAPHGMVAVAGGETILYGELAGDEPLGESPARYVTTIMVGELPFARLHLAWRADGRPLDAREELMLGRLLTAAGQAIRNALEHQDAQLATDPDPDADTSDRDLDAVPERAVGPAVEQAVGAERERIARDLHDTVIQRLFATGMQLQMLRRTADEGTEAAIAAVVRDLDTTMRDLRAVVFGLRRPRKVSVLGQMEGLVAEYAPGLGFRPLLNHSGSVDALLEGDLGDHVLATLREALSNMLKHARATAATIELHVSPAWTMLRVCDNGVGIPVGEAGVLGSGLANLRTRAERLGGLLRIEGSRLDWIVPTSR